MREGGEGRGGEVPPQGSTELMEEGGRGEERGRGEEGGRGEERGRGEEGGRGEMRGRRRERREGELNESVDQSHD